MAIVKIRNLDTLRKKLNVRTKIIMNKAIRSKKLRDNVGKVIAQDIRDNYNEEPKEFTKIMREFLEQFNSTHKDYRRNKINITFSGELLNDLASNVKADTINLGFIIEHSDKKHSTYKSGGTFAKKTVQVTSLKTRKTTNREVKKTMKQISKHLTDDLGHKYLKVTEKAQKEILKLVRDEIFLQIKKEFGR